MHMATSALFKERKGFGAASTLVLWMCIALFFLRVVGQIEVLLVAPAWLPEMSAWYSGLLPYPILLPLQIVLLMLMCGLVVRRSMMRPNAGNSRAVSGRPRRTYATMWRTLAILYFTTMAVRLVVCLRLYGQDYYLHGAIPIAFHWVLALFVLGCARRPRAHASGVS